MSKDTAVLDEEAKFSEFANRLKTACDSNDLVPEYNKGRLTWIVRELERFDVEVTKESVRRWFAGISMPRQGKLRALAELLKVTEAWLAVGDDSSGSFSEQKKKRIYTDGAVNLALGIFSSEGFAVAHVEDDDPKRNDIHFYTIINARQVAIRASSADLSGVKVTFSASNAFEKVVSLGFVRVAPLQFKVVRIPAAAVSKIGVRKGSHIEVRGEMTADGVRFKDDFAPFLTDLSALMQGKKDW